MPISLPLKDMTLQEKLAVMESIWEDLARIPEAIDLLPGTRTSSTNAASGSPRAHLVSPIGKRPKRTFARICRENRDPG